MRKLLLISLLASIIISCKKEDKTVDPVVSAPNYIPLHVGDYKVYRVYTIYPNSIDSSAIDSLIISRDTSINGHTYFIEEGQELFNQGNWVIKQIVRDSSGYLVNHQGEILFSATNFSDTLFKKYIGYSNDTTCVISYKMKPGTFSMNTPAGAFSSLLNYEGTVMLKFPIQGIPNPRYTNNYYAIGIGSVYKTSIFLGSNGGVNEKLLRYHIQQ